MYLWYLDFWAKVSSYDTTCTVFVVGKKTVLYVTRAYPRLSFHLRLKPSENPSRWCKKCSEELFCTDTGMFLWVEILTTAVLQRGIVCEQSHKEESKPAEVHNETSWTGFDQISTYLHSECNLVSTAIALRCDSVNLSFSACVCARSLEPADAEKSWAFCVLILFWKS